MQKMVKSKSLVRKAIIGGKDRRQTVIETPMLRQLVSQDDSSPHLKRRASKLDEDGSAVPSQEDKRKKWANDTLKIFNTMERDETEEEQEVRRQA